MPASHWDRLPTEIKSNILKSSDPLTRYVNNDLTQKEIELYGTDIWKVAFKINYTGDLSKLPQTHFPNIHNGLKFVKSRSMYHRLCNLKPSLVDWQPFRIFLFTDVQGLDCQCGYDDFDPVHVCFHYKLLVTIPIFQNWDDELPSWWSSAPICNIVMLACSMGHFDMVKSLFENNLDALKAETWALETGFHKAATFGYLDIVKFLWNADVGIDVASNDFFGMYNAIANGHADVVSFLLNQCIMESKNGPVEFDNVFAFAEACEYGHIDVVKVLRPVVDMESMSDDRRSKIITVVVQSRKVEVIKYLVEVAGFNDVVFCHDGFIKAVEIGFVEGVEVLAKVDGVDISCGREIALERGNKEMVKILSGGYEHQA
ncbi:hypothetical protein HDU76_004018 [Blyttiomyces sp. JEL0837]|nr:hypothetical protein HDU76_004018 [Blyttiomyces sp. JEL0837]